MYSILRTPYAHPDFPSTGFNIGSLFFFFLTMFSLLDIPQVGYSLRLGHPLFPRFQPLIILTMEVLWLTCPQGPAYYRAYPPVPIPREIYAVCTLYIWNRLDVICVTCGYMPHIILHTTPPLTTRERHIIYGVVRNGDNQVRYWAVLNSSQG